MAKFNVHTTSDEASEALKDSIAGKTIIITGVSPNSLGADTARAVVAHKPGKLILASQTESKLREVQEGLNIPQGTDVQLLVLNLASLEAVRKAATEVLDHVNKIDVMICTAGVMGTPYQKSEDGIELQFAVNHLGHFLFVNLLLEKLLLGDSTVVTYNSEAQTCATPAWLDDITYNDGKNYNKWVAYSNSKFADVLLSVGLVDRFGKRGLRSFSVDPGVIVTTTLTRSVAPEEFRALGWVDENGNLSSDVKTKTCAEGSATGIIAAFDRRLSNEKGYFLADGNMTEEGVHAAAIDVENARRLWKISEDLVKQTF
ncbi:Short-chain dehydrogenase TIC 32 [Cladobotryum mycophilum]|uniref:Short-chain dehydrogenase TIC 32 n=1 Tax=Cladobotryum mycophilum TaxID=491253 RepID=A0ABR0SIV1_9HYPO